MGNKFHANKVWIVPGNQHKFRSEHDAKYYCQQNGIDFATVEKYDSDREHERWLELQQMERDRAISNLRRQVKYEIIPNQYDYVLAKEKPVTDYFVHNGMWQVYFKSMKAARDYCKTHGFGYNKITKQERVERKYKKVLAERSLVYTADFIYDEGGETVVEDVKSAITIKERDYVIVRKSLRHWLNIKLRETL